MKGGELVCAGTAPLNEGLVVSLETEELIRLGVEEGLERSQLICTGIAPLDESLVVGLETEQLVRLGFDEKLKSSHIVCTTTSCNL